MDTSARFQTAPEIGSAEGLVAAHETALLRYAARLVNNPDAAQDVVQNAFIKFFRRWTPGALPAAAARNYLFRVTHNEAVDYIRRESRLRRLHEHHARDRELAADCRADPNADQADRLQDILADAQALDPAEQQVLLLRLQEGLSYEDIGRITGRSIGNVGCLLHHAVKKLSRRRHDQAL